MTEAVYSLGSNLDPTPKTLHYNRRSHQSYH